MSKPLPFFKFDTDSWLTGKIQLLTAAEKGIFIDLIARIWHENGQIKNDGILHRLLRVEKATLSDALQAFFDLGIMEEKDGFLSVKFIDNQIKTHNEFIEKQREFGAKGGRPKKGTKANKERRKKKEEIRNEKEDIRKEIEEKENTPTPSHDEFYPKTVDDVIRIAQSPLCGMKCSQEQAEMYFTFRVSTDWEDAARRKILPGKVPYDLKKWLMREEQKKNPAENSGNRNRGFGKYADGKHLTSNPEEFGTADEV